MSPTTQNDVELSLALKRVIQMCAEQILEADKRRTQAQTLLETYQARLEQIEWERALMHLTAAQRLRGE